MATKAGLQIEWEFVLLLAANFILFYFVGFSFVGSDLALYYSSWNLFLPFFVLYGLSHCLRAARLYILLLEYRSLAQKISFMSIATSFISTAIPYKLGETVRLFFFLAFSGDRGRKGKERKERNEHNKRIEKKNIIAAWGIEKYFDLFFLSLLAAYFTWGMRVDINVYLALAFYLFVAINVVLFAIVSLLPLVIRLLILTSTSQKGMRILQFLHNFIMIKDSFKGLLHSRIPVIILLTLVIWSLEALAFHYFILPATHSIEFWRSTMLEKAFSFLRPETFSHIWGGEVLRTTVGSYLALSLFIMSIVCSLILIKTSSGTYARKI